MIDKAKQLLTAHPTALDESYGEHFGHALSYAWRLQKSAFCALVHAILPFLFEKTASTEIRRMYAEMTNRGATKGLDQSQNKVAP